MSRDSERREKPRRELSPELFIVTASDFGSIVSYMLRQITPTISTVTKDNLEELQLIDLPLVISFIKEDDQTSRELLTSIAEEYKDRFLFGISPDITLTKSKSEPFKPPFIVLYNPSDHIDRMFSGPFDSNNIGSFLSGVSTPLIGKFSMETYYTYTQVSYISRFHLKIKSSKAYQTHLHPIVRTTPGSHLRKNRTRTTFSCRGSPARR
jgi:hypothetical protein